MVVPIRRGRPQPSMATATTTDSSIRTPRRPRLYPVVRLVRTLPEAPWAPGAWKTAGVPFTLVSFHAHPDDEALLTGGTLARAAAEGHRVVLVTATAGEAGLVEGTEGPSGVAVRRRAELAASARAPGVARVVELGYPDSGYGASGRGASNRAFSLLPPDEPAARLTDVLREEQADVLTSYDPAGGYGHPDHVQVHRVGALAAAAAGTPV